MMLAAAIALLLAAAMSAGGDRILETKRLYFDKGVIVQLMEWKWKDIAVECETFLAHKGFSAVQISPPSENRVVDNRPWWERYQVVSYQLTSRSGTHKELVDMIRRCNNVGVWIFADVVINHMTGVSDDCEGTGGSHCEPTAFSYPVVPYEKKHFHHPQCIVKDFSNATEVRVCNINNLLDLDTSNAHVQKKIADYLNHLTHIGIAGFRIDSAKYISPEDLSGIYKHLKHLNPDHGFPLGTSPYIYHHVIDKGNHPIKAMDYIHLGFATDATFSRELGKAFKGKNELRWLFSFGLSWNLLPDDKGIVFIDDHETERDKIELFFLNHKTARAYKMAVAFMLAFGYGTPKIMSSYHFTTYDDPPPTNKSTGDLLSPQPDKNNICKNGFVCQHRWRQIYNMVTFYNVVDGTNVNSWWSNGNNQISFCRGNKGFVAFNLETVDMSQKLQTCLPSGYYCDVISGSYLGYRKCSGKQVFVDEDHTAQISIPAYDPSKPGDSMIALHLQGVQETRSN